MNFSNLYTKFVYSCFRLIASLKMEIDGAALILEKNGTLIDDIPKK